MCLPASPADSKVRDILTFEIDILYPKLFFLVYQSSLSISICRQSISFYFSFYLSLSFYLCMSLTFFLCLSFGPSTQDRKQTIYTSAFTLIFCSDVPLYLSPSLPRLSRLVYVPSCCYTRQLKGARISSLLTFPDVTLLLYLSLSQPNMLYHW